MQYLIAIAFIVGCFCFRGRRGIYCALALLLVMLIISVLVPSVNDIANYEYRYENAASFDQSIGYGTFSGVAQMFGVPFRAFLATCVVLSSGAILWSYYRLSRYPEYSFALFSIYPFLLQIGQLRTGLATAFIAVAIACAFTSRRYKWLKVVVALVTAVSFHYAFVAIAAIVIFAMLSKERIEVRPIVMVSVIVAVILMLFVLFGGASLVNDRVVSVYPRAQTWVSAEPLILPKSFIAQLVEHVLMLVLTYFAIKQTSCEEASHQDREFRSFLLKVNAISAIFIPIYLLNATAFRFIRFTLILDYIPIAEALVSMRKEKKMNWLQVGAIILLILLFVLDFCRAQQGLASIVASAWW